MADEREDQHRDETDAMSGIEEEAEESPASTVDDAPDDVVGDAEENTSDVEPTEVADPEEPAAADSEPVKVKTGRGVAWLSLLIALGALAGAGYLYYETKVQDPLAALSQQLQAQSDDAQALEQRITQLADEQGAALRQALSDQQVALERTRAQLADSLNEVAAAAPPSEDAWKLAEAEYLLRIANHRVLMESDVDSARQLLTTADEILEGLDDFGLHAVRARLADEILSLKNVPSQDVEGIFLRLEAVKSLIDELPLEVPDYLRVAAENEGPDRPENLWSALSERFGNYLRIRSVSAEVKPLLSPDEAIYLEQNLRLMIERAQLAALKKHQAVYEESLHSTQEWLRKYLDGDDARVQSLIGELDDLLDVQFDHSLPDVSGSLKALIETRRSAS